MRKRNPQQMGLELKGEDAPQFVNSHHQAAMPTGPAIKCDQCDQWREYQGNTEPAGVFALDADGSPSWVCSDCNEHHRCDQLAATGQCIHEEPATDTHNGRITVRQHGS